MHGTKEEVTLLVHITQAAQGADLQHGTEEEEEEWKREHSQALMHAGRWRVMLARWAPNMSGDNRRGSSGARTTGDKKAPQSPQASGLRGRSSPEKMSFSFITLTSRLDLPTVALSMICSGL